MVLKNSDVMERFEEGYSFLDERTALSILERAFFIDRSVAEGDESYRQVIPYLTLIDSGKILLLKRTERQTEKRLHNLLTIGVGGHVNESDGKDPIRAFKKGLFRELEEEVDFDVDEMIFSGVINSLENEVSRVHVGFHYIVFGSFRKVREEENFEWRLVELEELMKLIDSMEGWSRLAMVGLRYHLSRR